MAIVARRNGEVIVKHSTVYPFRIPIDSIVCVFCSGSYEEPAEFRKHMDLEHDTFSVLLAFAYSVNGFVKADCSDIRCRICLEKSDSVEKIAFHLQKQHSDIANTLDLTSPLGIQPYNFNFGKYKCAMCEIKFFSLRQLSRHTLSHFLRYTCEICGKTYSTNSGLQSHIKCSHIRKHYCKKCKTYFNTADDKKTHIQESQKCWSFPCNMCCEIFVSYKAKQFHIKETHDDVEKKLYTCPECGKVFQYKKACADHFKEVHTEDHFTCSFCMQNFATKGKYEQHLLKHTKVKAFKCSICLRSYNRKKNLTYHVCKAKQEKS